MLVRTTTQHARSLPDQDCQSPSSLPELAFASRPPVKLVTNLVLLTIPIFCCMRPLLGPYYESYKGREPQDGVDNIDQGMGIRGCEAFGALEGGESRLIDQGGYAKPALSN